MTSSRATVRWLGTAVTCIVVGLLLGAWRTRSGTAFSLPTQSLEAFMEAVLAVVLFCTGLKLSGPLDWPTWRVPLGLACVSMPVTVALGAGAASVFLGLPMHEALLLGAVLGPTDPVLAASIELQAARGDATRFALGAEGALGACLAFPVVLFALGLNGEHALGPFALRWLVLDVIWGLGGGVLCGWLAGTLVARAGGRLGLQGQIGQQGAVGIGALASLAGALVLAASVAYLVAANALVAALAAGAAIARAGVLSARPTATPRRAQVLAVSAARIERLAELGFFLVLGALLAGSGLNVALMLYGLLVLIAVRPVAAGLALPAAAGVGPERRSIAWFGVRGAPSLCYVLFAVDQNLSARSAGELLAATVCVLAVSIALHGITALPLAKRRAGEQG